MERNIFKGIASVFSGGIAIMLFSIVLTPIIVRILGPSNYGEYAFVLSVIAILTILTDTTFRDSLRKYASENIESTTWVTGVVGFHTRTAGIMSVAVAATMALLVYTVSRVLSVQPDLALYLYISSIIVLLRPIFGLPYSLLMAYNLEHLSQVLKVIHRTVFALAGITLAYVGFGVTGLLAGTILGLVVGGGVGIVYLRDRIPVRELLSRSALTGSIPGQSILHYLFLNAVLIVAFNSLYHLDIILLRVFTGDLETGLYKGALVIAQLLWFVPNAVRTVFLHSASELWERDDVGKISEMSSLATRYTVLLTTLLAIGTAVLADVFVPLYFGPGFDASVVPLLILLPGVVGFAAVRPIIAVGQGKGSLRILLVATTGAAILNLVLNVTLIPRYGMLGAAVATSLSYASMFVFHVAGAFQIGFNPISDLRVPSILGVVAASGILISAFDTLIESDTLSLLLIPPLGFLCYVVLSVVLGAVDVHELRRVADQMPILANFASE